MYACIDRKLVSKNSIFIKFWNSAQLWCAYLDFQNSNLKYYIFNNGNKNFHDVIMPLCSRWYGPVRFSNVKFSNRSGQNWGKCLWIAKFVQLQLPNLLGRIFVSPRQKYCPRLTQHLMLYDRAKEALRLGEKASFPLRTVLLAMHRPRYMHTKLFTKCMHKSGPYCIAGLIYYHEKLCVFVQSQNLCTYMNNSIFEGKDCLILISIFIEKLLTTSSGEFFH